MIDENNENQETPEQTRVRRSARKGVLKGFCLGGIVGAAMGVAEGLTGMTSPWMETIVMGVGFAYGAVTAQNKPLMGGCGAAAGSFTGYFVMNNAIKYGIMMVK